MLAVEPLTVEALTGLRAGDNTIAVSAETYVCRFGCACLNVHKGAAGAAFVAGAALGNGRGPVY